MNVALQDLQSLCSKSELTLLRASQSPDLAQWTAVELKRHAVLARKLTDKWQGLARDQARVESRKSGSPNLLSRSHQKHALFQGALQAFETQLAVAERTMPGSSGFTKATSELRNRQAREVRQSTRKDLLRTKQAINKTTVKSATKSATKTATKSAKKTAKKTATKAAKKTARTKSSAPKRKVKGVKKPLVVAAVVPASKKPATKKTAVKAIAPVSALSQRTIEGKLKARRLANAGRSPKIASHISAQGKRTQARRDAKR